MSRNKFITFLLVFIFCFNFTISANPVIVAGDWFYYTDLNNKGDSKIMIDGKERGECKIYNETVNGEVKEVYILAGYVTTKFAYGFIGMGMKPKPEAVAALKTAKGIKFKAMGDGKQYRCRLECSNVKDFDHFGKIFKSTPNYTEVTVLFSQVQQEGWGVKLGFNKNFISQFSFQTIGQPHKSVLLKICDLEFVQ